ncbi:T9SS type A sorting domain-containing protein [Polaribacter vadi]|uniref:T9SS type A sorting domain-containing protein n=1 Tax=Polaribacter TaxID=52959 RepID=UPI001C098D4F|nr:MULTISPECIES: T9SS type A sorting domain-containing protein [Polaribacter]MBU3010719.1 T9SS type A sorting domain-containing protein [Polaribacter vadi]MDO6740530.1 T9SS type A sorting domain-containing protein [Polaribacter sp. 1_MG-2023]
MKTTQKKNKTFKLFLLILLVGFFGYAQDEPFSCDYNAYLFQRNDIYALDLASGSSYLVKENVTEGNVNAVGYNPTDGYIWGALTDGSQTIVRIGKSFNVESFYVDELPTSSIYIGDVNSEGIYYLKGGGTTYYTIDLNPNSENYTKFISQGTFSINLSIHDWAFNAVDGYLYTVEKGTNHLYRINGITSEIVDLGEVPILKGLNYHFGAVYFDASGRFYVSANQTGTVYVIKDVQSLESGDTMDSNLFAFGPSSSSNDGARCPTAPVPQEDCINGLDDDGDGLTDCDDPSCSGVAECPVIVPEVSSGNDGGLESNDRLSQKINQRNYLRVKDNHKFDIQTAKKVVKTKKYKTSVAKNENIALQDLIPLDVIEGATAVESSATDLVDITNATELYSLDYVKNNETIAVVLATKTEDGVYEHTKFICDRLLGAELLSVSTIELFQESDENGEGEGVHFIKSIIKNSNGSKEFVLSFSGRLINNDENFQIDSHWNIDKYEAGATYYNFQIWASSIDDLLTLGHEALELFEVQKPITNYDTSSPPPIFVKKGEYVNGKLELELINVRRSSSAVIDAGFKRTETSDTEYFNNTIQLNGNYIEHVTIETGNIFDIGFRIENEFNLTPDDLFMSDGVWGKDDSPAGTTVTEFTISQNDNVYTGSGYRVERNISLKANTSEYVAVFRSFTPRFTALDLSEYDVLEFDASGTGDIEITILKESVDAWESQFRTTVTLTEGETHYAIPYSYFKSTTEGDIDLSDAVNMVFTMSSDGQTAVDKELELKNIEFTQQALSVGSEVIAENESIIYPNPLSTKTNIRFYSEIDTKTKIEVYSLTGALIRRVEVETQIGNNSIELFRQGLKRGLYLVKVSNDYRNYTASKLVVD